MKKNFKKSMVFIIILVLILSLTACVSDKKAEPKTETNTSADSDKKGGNSATFRPGDEVPDGDKAKPATDNTLYGGAEVGNPQNTETKGVDISLSES